MSRPDVEGLLAGGDDYLVKPFHFSELSARVTSLARRPAGKEPATRLVVHDLMLDLLSHTARRDDVVIDLQAKEFTLLEVLMRNAGRIITKTMLLEQVWVHDGESRVKAVAKKAGVNLTGFVRFALGEGIEKPKDDFAAEVAATAGVS